MKSKFKTTMAFIASLAMCSSLLLNFPNETFMYTVHVSAANTDVAINEINFPDEIFRTYVDNNFDTTDDGFLTDEEIAAVTQIDVSYMGISDLTGVEFFSALEQLDCFANSLTTLDLSSCTALESLYCYYNALTDLDVSNNAHLKILNCQTNNLDTLDVSNNTELTVLNCSNNQLTNLDVTKNAVLTELSCNGNQLTNLDLSQNRELTELNCIRNQLTNLDLSQNTALITLYCNNNQLTSLDISNCTMLDLLDCFSNQLTNLDLSQNTVLSTLHCGENQLTNLDLSHNPLLFTLSCNINELTNLDLSQNTVLNNLTCSDNYLTDLDLSQNTALIILYCNHNQLTDLELNQNALLEVLACSDNYLTSLNLSNHVNLASLECSGNYLSGLDLSGNPALIISKAHDNVYDITLTGSTFDLSTLPGGFDVNRASEWKNASIDNTILTVTNPTMDITYIYDLGNGITETFTLHPVSTTITADMVSAVEKQVYTGAPVEPEISLSYCGMPLVMGEHFTVTYMNNTDVGTATATITGMGGFLGEISVAFEIYAETTATETTTDVVTTPETTTETLVESDIPASDTTSTPSDTTTVVKGDADNDGDVDTADAAKVLDFVDGLIKQFGNTAEEHNVIADAVDIDCDGAITKTDAALILSFNAQNSTWEELTFAIVPAAEIDMTALNTKLAEAEAIKNINTYTEESYAALQTAITVIRSAQNAEMLPSDYTAQMINLLDAATEDLEANLPQTGYPAIYNYIMIAAAAMVLFGIYAIAKSKKETESHF